MRLEDDLKEIRFNQFFLNSNPGITGEQIKKGLVQGPWFLPTLDSNYWIPGMGTTAHKSMPSAIPVHYNENGEVVKVLEVFIKPFELSEWYLAENEFQNSKKAIMRGINTPTLIALVKTSHNALLLCDLLHDVSPLSAWNLDYKRNDPRVYNPRDLLRNFVKAIANIHNQGILHGDLHLGNTGYQFQKLSTPKIIFFDLETSYVLSDSDLSCKNDGICFTSEQKRRIEIFEEDVAIDLADFIADLRFSGLTLRKSEIIKDMLEAYRSYRIPSLGILAEREFKKRLLANYLQIGRSLRYSYNS